MATSLNIFWPVNSSPVTVFCFKYIQRYTSMNCFKFTHDIDEILENPMMYFIIYVPLMETCFKEIYYWNNISVFEFFSGGLIHSNIVIGVFRIPGGPSSHITMLNVESSDTGSWPQGTIHGPHYLVQRNSPRHHNPRALILSLSWC